MESIEIWSCCRSYTLYPEKGHQRLPYLLNSLWEVPHASFWEGYRDFEGTHGAVLPDAVLHVLPSILSPQILDP